MNDNDIIKALEDELKTALTVNHRFMEAWDTENPDDDRFIALLSNTLDLIICQKAEIERLTGFNENLQTANTALSNEILDIKAEAIKEFAERLKEEVDGWYYDFANFDDTMDALNDIDNLVKEMTEGEDD